MGVRLTDDCKGEILYLRMLFLGHEVQMKSDFFFSNWNTDSPLQIKHFSRM